MSPQLAAERLVLSESPTPAVFGCVPLLVVDFTRPTNHVVRRQRARLTSRAFVYSVVIENGCAVDNDAALV